MTPCSTGSPTTVADRQFRHSLSTVLRIRGNPQRCTLHTGINQGWDRMARPLAWIRTRQQHEPTAHNRGRYGAGQPAGAADQLHWTPIRDRSLNPRATRDSTADADRHRRNWQNAAGDRGGSGAARAVPGRGVAGRARRAGRPRSGGPGDRGLPGHSRGRRTADLRAAARCAVKSAGPAGTR
jgi:hypothetical protein